MIRSLAIITVSGFIVAGICLSIACVMIGRDVSSGKWKARGGPFSEAMTEIIDQVKSDIEVDMAPAEGYGVFWEGETATRDIPWTGAAQIDVGMPADVTYSQGPTPKITVTGPSGSVDRFLVSEGGNLRLRGWSAMNTFTTADQPEPTGDRDRPPRLTITVIAPSVTRFDLSGTETLTINGYNQAEMHIDASGLSRVTAHGAAKHLELDLSGGATADLAGLNVETLEADLSDSAEASAAPTQEAQVDADGESRLNLTSRPQRIIRDVSDGAMVREVEAAK